MSDCSPSSSPTAEPKYACIAKRLIMQAHLNAAGRLFGGMLLAWVDETAALFTMDVVGSERIVTKKISEVLFNEPGFLGDILEFSFRVESVGISSLTLDCRVTTRPLQRPENSRSILNCEMVFVMLDRNGRPTPHGLTLEEARHRSG